MTQDLLYSKVVKPFLFTPLLALAPLPVHTFYTHTLAPHTPKPPAIHTSSD